MQQLPIPPFTKDSAPSKVQGAEDAWSTRDAAQVALLCSPECVWRHRGDSFQGRAAIEYFLQSKWKIESNTKLMKEPFSYTDNRISVQFECEWQDARSGQWFRRYGIEHWEFDADGFMTRRDMSTNDIRISANERRIEI